MNFLKTLTELKADADTFLIEIMKYFENFSSRKDDSIDDLKLKLEQERKLNHKLRTIHTDEFANKSELESFFYECIQEVRREISFRKTNYASNTSKSYVRSSFPRVSVGTSEQQSVKTPRLSDFTRSDKKKVLHLLVSNDELLLSLYERIFKPDKLSEMQNTNFPSLFGVRDDERQSKRKVAAVSLGPVSKANAKRFERINKLGMGVVSGGSSLSVNSIKGSENDRSSKTSPKTLQPISALESQLKHLQLNDVLIPHPAQPQPPLTIKIEPLNASPSQKITGHGNSSAEKKNRPKTTPKYYVKNGKLLFYSNANKIQKNYQMFNRSLEHQN